MTLTRSFFWSSAATSIRHLLPFDFCRALITMLVQIHSLSYSQCISSYLCRSFIHQPWVLYWLVVKLCCCWFVNKQLTVFKASFPPLCLSSSLPLLADFFKFPFLRFPKDFVKYGKFLTFLHTHLVQLASYWAWILTERGRAFFSRSRARFLLTRAGQRFFALPRAFQQKHYSLGKNMIWPTAKNDVWMVWPTILKMIYKF